MSWEYRVIKTETEKEDVFQIFEIYYDDDDNIEAWTEDCIAAMGSDKVENLKEDLENMKKACSLKPILKSDLETGINRKETL